MSTSSSDGDLLDRLDADWKHGRSFPGRSNPEFLLKLHREVSRLPAVREERVRELQRLLRTGNYHVPSEYIAEAMFRDLLEPTLRESRA